MPEGDTIHRIARRIEDALVGRPLARVEAPNPRSPLHRRAAELEGATIERAEARGKHLLLHLTGDRVLHNHLGIGGRWQVATDGRLPRGRPWLLLVADPEFAALNGSKLLRLTSAARARNDPVLARLGPDPLAPDFDPGAAAARLLRWEPAEQVGAALLDQRLLAGVGNVIRIEALHLAAVSPWRPVGELSEREASELVDHGRRIMETTVREGRRPKRIYGALARRPCPRCGGTIRRHRQGDDSRVTYWCEDCQR